MPSLLSMIYEAQMGGGGLHGGGYSSGGAGFHGGSFSGGHPPAAPHSHVGGHGRSRFRSWGWGGVGPYCWWNYDDDGYPLGQVCDYPPYYPEAEGYRPKFRDNSGPVKFFRRRYIKHRHPRPFGWEPVT